MDNKKLQIAEKISFPILAAVNGYVQEKEDFEIIAVVADSIDEGHNYQELCNQAKELFSGHKGRCTIKKVVIDSAQGVSTQVDSFQQLIDYVDDGDELFLCMTYGTKPQSQVMMMAVQYAYRVKENVSVECILYGEVDRFQNMNEPIAKIYDMTGLMQLDEVVRILGERKVKCPEKIIRDILSL